MLILRRRAGESIVISGHIRVEVAEIAGNQVKLVIEAPKEVPVYREEVWEQIRREMIEAAAPSGVPGEEGVTPSVSSPGEGDGGGLEVAGGEEAGRREPPPDDPEGREEQA